MTNIQFAINSPIYKINIKLYYLQLTQKHMYLKIQQSKV